MLYVTWPLLNSGLKSLPSQSSSVIHRHSRTSGSPSTLTHLSPPPFVWLPSPAYLVLRLIQWARIPYLHLSQRTIRRLSPGKLPHHIRSWPSPCTASQNMSAPMLLRCVAVVSLMIPWLSPCRGREPRPITRHGVCSLQPRSSLRVTWILQVVGWRRLVELEHHEMEVYHPGLG